ncbi:MAG: hypothetical protein ACLUE1_02070 [Adlercreutzia equolifaciens]
MTGQGTMTGKVFGGRYEIKDRIGIGGMAELSAPRTARWAASSP